MSVDRIAMKTDEIRNQTLDYSQWLNTGVAIIAVSVDVTPVTTPAMTVTPAIGTGGTEVVLNITMPDPGGDYSITIEIDTNSLPVEKKVDCLEVQHVSTC